MIKLITLFIVLFAGVLAWSEPKDPVYAEALRKYGHDYTIMTLTTMNLDPDFVAEAMRMRERGAADGDINRRVIELINAKEQLASEGAGFRKECKPFTREVSSAWTDRLQGRDVDAGKIVQPHLTRRQELLKCLGHASRFAVAQVTLVPSSAHAQALRSLSRDLIEAVHRYERQRPSGLAGAAQDYIFALGAGVGYSPPSARQSVESAAASSR